MRLAVESDLSVLEAFDDVHLPQRATAIEQRGVQPCDQRLKLLHSPGAAQRDAAHMVIEVDIVVLDPNRLGKFKRHLRQLAMQHRSEVQALAEHRLDILVVVALITLGKLEKHQAADMHRRFRRFEMQKRGVNAAELIHSRGSFVVSIEPRPGCSRMSRRQATVFVV